MIINVASTNEIKIDAVKQTLKEYPFLSDAVIKSVKVESNVSEQPLSLDETTQGAINRAKSAFDKDCKYSIGLESGLFQVPNTKTGYMDTCVCAIYDGKNTQIGLSCSFELPIEVTKIIISEKLDINQAYTKIGLTKKDKIGSAEGAIGHLTKGRIDRKAYTIQAIKMALIQIENPELYINGK